ncbi:class F sortase [Aeromicrobium sp. CF4.19]|uniref:class F sortase n=1 Tax=Aeromicrobium sp. CF4.19 TaxID=3373082 RepID=UPI003EE7A958
MKKNLLATITAAALVAAAVFVNLPEDEPGRGEPEAVAAAPSPSPEPARDMADGPVGTPERLEITSLDVDAPVMAVGSTPDNAQEVPAALDETGWWRDGAVPGASGNAVIVGHTASSDDGVFDPLVDIEEGDEVIVTGEDGSLAFDVVRSEVVPVADFGTVAADIYRTEGDSGLVLMTCGDWNGEEFETTVIVHAEPA